MGLYIYPNEIRDWLGVIDSEKYTDDFLINLIMMKMEYIDRLTATKWNGEVGWAVEYHDITRPRYGFWIFRLGYPIYLEKMYVKHIIRLDLYDGSKWVDMLGNDEGREKSYWVDREEGIIYINRFMWPIGGKEVKVEYEYGRDELPGYIRELTLLHVVRDLLMNERRLFALAEGASGISLSEQMKYINERIFALEEMVRAIRIPKMSLEKNPALDFK